MNRAVPDCSKMFQAVPTGNQADNEDQVIPGERDAVYWTSNPVMASKSIDIKGRNKAYVKIWS